jgi:putative transposase
VHDEMPRRPSFVGEFVYHVINRAAARMRLFETSQDYVAVQELLFEVKAAIGIRLLAYCIMPNHWHLILWPRNSDEMSQFLQQFTGTHAQRWRAAHESTGAGAVYQGRYRAFPIQTGVYFLNACRYVERNPLRASLVDRAEDWRWSSCGLRLNAQAADVIESWPVTRPDNWLNILNSSENAKDLEDVRTSVNRSIPLGEPTWVEETAKLIGAESHLRRPGRPGKRQAAKNPSRPLLSDA